MPQKKRTHTKLSRALSKLSRARSVPE